MNASNSNPFNFPTQHNRYGLPAYIHGRYGRAFLVLACDIHGRWNAGYTYWLEAEDPGNEHGNGIGHYAIIQPTVNDCDSPDEAMETLAIAKAVYESGA